MDGQSNIGLQAFHRDGHKAGEHTTPLDDCPLCTMPAPATLTPEARHLLGMHEATPNPDCYLCTLRYAPVAHQAGNHALFPVPNDCELCSDLMLSMAHAQGFHPWFVDECGACRVREARQETAG